MRLLDGIFKVSCLLVYLYIWLFRKIQDKKLSKKSGGYTIQVIVASSTARKKNLHKLTTSTSIRWGYGGSEQWETGTMKVSIFFKWRTSQVWSTHCVFSRHAENWRWMCHMDVGFSEEMRKRGKITCFCKHDSYVSVKLSIIIFNLCYYYYPMQPCIFRCCTLLISNYFSLQPIFF